MTTAVKLSELINGTSSQIVVPSGGVNFGTSTDGSGTVTGGVLDDYEEGTWQMRWSEDGLQNDTKSLNEGTETEVYVKIGSLVYLRGQITYSDNSNIIDGYYLFCSGLPFAISGFCQGTMTVYNNSGATAAQFTIEDFGTARLRGIKNSDYSTPGSMTWTSDSGAGSFPSAGKITFSVIYKAI